MFLKVKRRILILSSCVLVTSSVRSHLSTDASVQRRCLLRSILPWQNCRRIILENSQLLCHSSFQCSRRIYLLIKIVCWGLSKDLWEKCLTSLLLTSKLCLILFTHWKQNVSRRVRSCNSQVMMLLHCISSNKVSLKFILDLRVKNSFLKDSSVVLLSTTELSSWKSTAKFTFASLRNQSCRTWLTRPWKRSHRSSLLWAAFSISINWKSLRKVILYL